MEELIIIREHLIYPAFSDPLTRRLLKILLKNSEPALHGPIIGIK